MSKPHRVGRIILLNTFYGHAPSLRLPEMIRLFADPNFVQLADTMIDDENQRLWLLWHTARRFGLDPLDPSGIGTVSITPQFFGDAETPDALAAVRAWTGALSQNSTAMTTGSTPDVWPGSMCPSRCCSAPATHT